MSIQEIREKIEIIEEDLIKCIKNIESIKIVIEDRFGKEINDLINEAIGKTNGKNTKAKITED